MKNVMNKKQMRDAVRAEKAEAKRSEKELDAMITKVMNSHNGDFNAWMKYENENFGVNTTCGL